MQYAIEIASDCNFQVSQGSVNIFKVHLLTLIMCVQNFLRNQAVKEFRKSVYICRSYDQSKSTA